MLGINLREVECDRRGFRVGDGAIRQRIEEVGRSFLRGYHLALENPDPGLLTMRLNPIADCWRGFAFEGAAMALALLDWLTPWRRNRWSNFRHGGGSPHDYMLHVGIGWAAARLPIRISSLSAKLDPLHHWLVIDGYGFHEGYFHWPKSVQAQVVPRRFEGYARRVFDQGLGRSLWFVEGADSTRIEQTIRTFADSRHSDLWSGVGLAAGYAGGVDSSVLESLGELAGPYFPQLAQGVAFAAKARQRAGSPAPHTELACQMLCGLSADDAAAITDACAFDLPLADSEPQYETWRQRIQGHFTSNARIKA
jgi:hypothetical protein